MSNIVLWPNNILRRVSQEEMFGPGLESLVEDMRQVIEETAAYGLAACQLGTSTRVFLAAIGEGKEYLHRKVRVFVNPSIVNFGGQKIKSVEQCLSLPGVQALLKTRYSEIVIAAFGADGEPFQERFGLSDAIVIQHEMRHLEGKTLLDEVGSAKRVLMKSKLRKAAKQCQQQER